MSENKKLHFVRGGFSLIEVTVAMIILAMIGVSVVTVMNWLIDGVIDTQVKTEAFELARENMEQILIAKSAKNTVEFGISETNPDMSWEKTIESFYEPVTNRMWMKAICSASYLDSGGEEQKVELIHWLNALSKKQAVQIISQQQKLAEYEDALAEDEFDDEESDEEQSDEETEEQQDDEETENEEDEYPREDDDYDPWKPIEDLVGPPPAPYESWGDMPDDELWQALIPLLFK